MIVGQLWDTFPQKTLILECRFFTVIGDIALISGRVYGTRWQILVGAQAPVAPSLTRTLDLEAV